MGLTAQWYFPDPVDFLKKPYEGETFALCGGVVSFDICALYRHLVAYPEHQVSRLNLRAFKPWLLNVSLDPEAVATADIRKAGIAVLCKGQLFLVDGNHRMQARLEQGHEHMAVYLVSEEEAKRFMTGDLIII